MFKIEVYENREEQRPYADRQTMYTIKILGDKGRINDNLILNFCTKVLTNCDKVFNDPDRAIYESYYDLKRADNKDDDAIVYVFTITEPYLD